MPLLPQHIEIVVERLALLQHTVTVVAAAKYLGGQQTAAAAVYQQLSC